MWRPVMAKLVSISDVNSGVVDIVDLLKINALLDMQAVKIKGPKK